MKAGWIDGVLTDWRGRGWAGTAPRRCRAARKPGWARRAAWGSAQAPAVVPCAPAPGSRARRGGAEGLQPAPAVERDARDIARRAPRRQREIAGDVPVGPEGSTDYRRDRVGPDGE